MDRAILSRVLVTDRTLAGQRGLVDVAAEACRRAAVTMILVRELDLPPAEQVILARRLIATVPATVIMSRRPDLAAQAGAAGVQLGQGSPALAVAREILGPAAIIGVSVHSVDEGMLRASEGADYLVLGPILATPKKAGILPPLGFGPLRELARRTHVPVVAIGGMDAAHEHEARAAGAAGVAAIRWFMQAGSDGRR